MVSPYDWVCTQRNESSLRRFTSEIWTPSEFRQRDVKLKQGSKSESVEKNEEAIQLYTQTVDASVKTYHDLMDMGVAPEMARSVLPLSLYTEFIETGSLAAYARLCKLRLDPSAQKEIQEYAQQVHDLILEKFPISWKYLM